MTFHKCVWSQGIEDKQRQQRLGGSRVAKVERSRIQGFKDFKDSWIQGLPRRRREVG